MALPERNVAMGWVGKTVIDRDGAEIGACTGVFADDATDLPEWVWVELSGVSVFVPLLDAIESGGMVRVAVVYADVVAAPPVGDSRRVSQEEEAALYRHYGIEYSKAASESLLPEAAESMLPASSHETWETIPEPVPVPMTQPDAPPPPPTAMGSQPAETPTRRSPGLLVPLGGTAGAAVAAVFAVRRLRTRRRSTLTNRTGRRARDGVVALTARSGQLAGSAAPLLTSTGQAVRYVTRSGTSVAGEAATVAGRRAGRLATTVGQAASQASTMAGRTGAISARRASSRAARLTAAAVARAADTANSGVAGGQRVGAAVGAVPGVVSESGEKLQKRWRKAMGKVTTVLGFGAGYVLGTKAGRERYVQLSQAATKVTRRPEVQQGVDRLKSMAGEKAQTSASRVRQRAEDVSAKLRGDMPQGPFGGVSDPSNDPMVDPLP